MFEINLVPDVKGEMIKAIKVRNILLFVCIIVSAVSIGVVMILFGIKAAQDITLNDQNTKLDVYSKKLGEFSNVDQYITIQNQLKNLNEISNQKTYMRRVFNILTISVPQGNNADNVQISQMDIDMETNTLSIEGQADARTNPPIDYRVLESFKKGFDYLTFDYGKYVDKDDNEIPAYCIRVDDAGNSFTDNIDGIVYQYAKWDQSKVGCDPESVSKKETLSAEQRTKEYKKEVPKITPQNDEDCTNPDNSIVCIYRTPRIKEWEKEKYTSVDGDRLISISGVPHFNSECISYRKTRDADRKEIWVFDDKTDENGKKLCLVADGGMTVLDSSNARNDEDQLVLRFRSNIVINPEVFSFNNQFMVFRSPERQNATDSYLQIQDIFAKPAKDCEAGDSACINNEANKGEEQ